MIKVRVSGKIPNIGKALRKAINGITDDLYTEIKQKTPVDTGFAKKSWQKKKGRTNVISSDVDYVAILDKGRHKAVGRKGMAGSKQAPKGMTGPAIKKIERNIRKGKYI